MLIIRKEKTLLGTFSVEIAKIFISHDIAN